MPYIATRRLHHIFGKKVSRYFMYRKARKMFSEINRELSNMEARVPRERGSAA